MGDTLGYLGPAADTEHDLPGRILLVKLPATRTRARVRVTRVVTLELIVEHPGSLPVGVPVRDVDPKLLHLLGELFLVVAERALEEVSPRVLRSLLDAVAMEPAITAGSPEHLLFLITVRILTHVKLDESIPARSHLQLHGTTPALVILLKHFHVLFILGKEWILDWFVSLAMRLVVAEELLEASMLQAAGKMVTFPAHSNKALVSCLDETILLALLAHAAQGGVLAFAVDTEEAAAAPPLLHNVFWQKSVDTLDTKLGKLFLKIIMRPTSSSDPF